MKKIGVLATMCFISFLGYSQGKEPDSERETIKQMVNGKDIMPELYDKRNNDAITSILKKYNGAIENRDITTMQDLFTEDAEIFESGESFVPRYISDHCNMLREGLSLEN